MTKSSSLYLSDLLTGLFCALVLKDQPTLVFRNTSFDRLLEMLLPDLSSEAAKCNLTVKFRIRLHPIHQDSDNVREELHAAARRDLISVDALNMRQIHIRVNEDFARRCIGDLPGSVEMYEGLADKLLMYYRHHNTPAA